MTRDFRKVARLFAAFLAAALIIPLTGFGVASAVAYQVGIGVKADKTTYKTLNELITFEVTVTNTGDNQLANAYAGNTSSGVQFSNPDVGVCYTATAKKPTLASGESFKCKATYRITQEDLDLGYINNQFEAFGTGPGSTVQRQTASPELSAIQTPGINLVKTATAGNPFKNAGDKITYKLEAENTGNVTLKNVTITDPKLGPIPAASCTPAPQAPPSTDGVVLAPGAKLTCTGLQYTVTQADVDANKVDNTATVIGTPPSGPNVSDTDDETVPGTPDPKIDLVKKATAGNPFAKVGDKITYSLEATNTGNQTLKNVTITDPKLGPIPVASCTPAPQAPPSTDGVVLAPGAKLTCTGLQYTVTQADVNANEVANTATATGKPPTGPDVTDTDKVTVPGTPDPKIDLVKKATAGNPFAKVGDKITYSLEATNTGNQTLTNVQITDPKLGTLTGCTPALGSTLAPNATMTCTGTYTVKQDDVDSNKVDNTATATGKPPAGPDVTDTDKVTVPGTPDPKIDLVKKATAGNPFAKAGDKITYSLVATNTGNQTLTNVQITDPKLGTLTGCTPALGSTLAPNATMTCTGTYTVKQDDVDSNKVDNTATATGKPPAGPDVTDTDKVTVPGTPDPKIDLVKRAISGNPFAKEGDKITYSLVSTNTGNVTLSNVTITDPKLGQLNNCRPALGSTLVPQASITCEGTYTVTQADVDAGEVKNTATTVGTPPSGPDVTDVDSANVPGGSGPAIDLVKRANPQTYTRVGEVIDYTLVATNTGSLTLSNVVITDPKLSNIKCDPASPATLKPLAKMTCTGQYTITQADVESGQVKNTARVTGQPPGGRPPVSDEDSAVVTGPNADLAITKSHTPASVTVGQNVNFVLTVRNLGPGTSYGVRVTDTLPSQLEFVSATGAGWSCSHAARVITCSLASPLAAGGSTTIDVVAKTIAAGSAIVNVAVVDANTPDPNPSNNRAEDVVGVTKNVIVCPTDTVQKVGKLVVKGCRDVNIRALCKVSKPSAQGSLSYCKVVRVKKNGNVKVLAKSQYPVKVKVVWYAPATDEYKAFRKVKRFTLQPNR